MTLCSMSRYPTRRLRHIVSLRRAKSDYQDDSRSYVGLENIESWTGRFLDTSADRGDSGRCLANDISLSHLFESGDVLFGKLRPYLAKAWIAEFPGRASTELLVMKPIEIESRFLRYVFVSRNFIDLVDGSTFGSKMPRADWSFISNVHIPVPEWAMQQAIADHLDREIERLDALVASKERLLELLAEKRYAFITHVVTRGLNPHITLRDSGIPWLDRIPEHWETWKLGHCATVGNGSTPNRSNSAYWDDGTIPWLNSSVVNQNEIFEADQFVTQMAVQECHLPIVGEESVLVAITGQGKTRGSAAVLSIRATINQHLAFVVPGSSKLDVWYLRWLLLVAYEFLRNLSDDAGGTKGALTCESISNLRIPLPPSHEQRRIVSVIASESYKYDRLSAATERTIDLLRERRAALITAAVTGQIDAKEMAA